MMLSTKPGAVHLDLIHDRWFAKSRIVIDVETNTLSIPFQARTQSGFGIRSIRPLRKRAKKRVLDSLLRIHHTLEYVIDDKAGIDIFDFNELKFDPRLRQVTITSGFPLTITATVDRFEVSVELANGPQ